MEICRCDEYKKIVNDFKITAISAQFPLTEIQPVEVCVKFVPMRTSAIDSRFEKAILVPNLNYSEKQEEVPQDDKKISSKWIPVSSVISLKLVNEGVGIVKGPYVYLK